jgi:hypothetical protein
LPTGLGQSGVDDRRDRGFRRGVADGAPHAFEEVEDLGPAHGLVAGCATDGRVYERDERSLANRLYVASMLAHPHDEITPVGDDGMSSPMCHPTCAPRRDLLRNRPLLVA